MIGGLLVVISIDLRQGRNSKLRAEVFVECCEIEVSQDLVNIIVILLRVEMVNQPGVIDI